MARELQQLKQRIGVRLKQRRQEVRLSQEDVAHHADISTTYLSQIEGGRRNPSLETLFRLAAAVQLDLAELFKS